ncbi:MAG TPA: hypothetical protein VF993_14680 [Myxococcales bacterium]
MKWLIALVASWAVCEPTFDPCLPLRTEVSGLQILGVRADPPEAVLAADGSPPAVTVTVLAVDRDGLSFPVRSSAGLLRSALESDPLLGYGGIRVQRSRSIRTVHSRSSESR